MDELKIFFRSRTKANLVMVISCVAVFIVLSMMGNTENPAFMLNHGACFYPLIAQGQYYRLFTAMFLHFGIVHLLYNMLALLFLGDSLEHHVGPVIYLMIYMTGGLFGNVLTCLWESHTGEYAVSAGASGAIFSVIGANLAIALVNRDRISRNYLRRLTVITILMIAQGFTEQGTNAVAHLSGCMAGFVLGLAAAAAIRKRRTGRIEE